MSLSSPLADPGFFGKDDFVPFIGQVVNVNDPKQSGRVKVRCLGWHPKDVKDLPDDDLPWARVGMPTTHAQIGRIGGKHGLLPGSMVMGFFLDGHDAQNPFVLTSFGATSNASEKTNTRIPIREDGKFDETEKALAKTTGPGGIGKPGQQLISEQGQKLPSDEADISGDSPPSNAKAPCGDGKPRQSLADHMNRDMENSPQSPTALNYKASIGDTRCGASAHAGERIQNVLKEFFPNDDVRFVFEDVAYNAITGERIDLEVVINFAAVLICDILKDSIENLRGLVNDTLFRPSRSVAIRVATKREPSVAKLADVLSKSTIDISNKIFTTIIDNLCDIIRDILKAINNGSLDGITPGLLSANGVTPIGNVGAQCVADTILSNILTLITSSLATELNLQFSQAQTTAGAVEDLIDDINDGDIDGALVNISEILGALGLATEFVEQASSILDFITEFKFTTNNLLFNTLGIFVLDFFNNDGCVKEGLISTSRGVLGSIGGGGGPGSTFEDFLSEADFGGLPPGSNTGAFSTIVCDEAIGTKIPGVDIPDTTCVADAVAVSVPSSEPNAARNFTSGIANSVVIKDPGCNFFFDRGDQILFDINNLFPPDDVL